MSDKKKKGSAESKKKSGTLGSGLAENAKKKLEGRGKSIDDAIAAAMGQVTQKKK
jgi:hypothetical protein